MTSSTREAEMERSINLIADLPETLEQELVPRSRKKWKKKAICRQTNHVTDTLLGWGLENSFVHQLTTTLLPPSAHETEGNETQRIHFKEYISRNTFQENTFQEKVDFSMNDFLLWQQRWSSIYFMRSVLQFWLNSYYSTFQGLLKTYFWAPPLFWL